MDSRQKKVAESCQRGAVRVEDGTHDGVDSDDVKAIARIPQAGAMSPFDPVRQALFLQALKDKPIVGRAARRAGVTVATAYRMRKRSPVFAAAWDESLCAGVDTLEECAIDRALSKSDKLLEMLLKGMRPETYREKVDALAAMRVNIVVDLTREGVAGDIVEGEIEEDSGALESGA